MTAPNSVEPSSAFQQESDIEALRCELAECRRQQAAMAELLRESREHQAATSEVLSVISRSPNEVQPVLDTIAATAQRLCEGSRAQIFIERNARFELAAGGLGIGRRR